MKKTLCLCLCALLLTAVFAGCSLQNRQPSSDFVPDGLPSVASISISAPPEEESTEPATVVMQVTVRDLVVEDGIYTDRYGNTYNYKYHVPYIDAEARYASGCNNEINKRFGAEVTAQLNAMQDLSTLTVLSVDYMTRLRDDFLTLYITMKDVSGETSSAIYTLDRFSGDEVDHAALLRWAGIPEEAFTELVMEAARALFEQTYGDEMWTEQVRYNTAFDRTMNEDNFTVDMPMYVDQSDRLIAIVTLYDLAGAKHTENVVLEYTPPAETAEP